MGATNCCGNSSDYSRLLLPHLVRDNEPVHPSKLRLLLSAQRIQSRVAELAAAIDADYPVSAVPRLHLVVALKGACFFAVDLARAIRRDVSLDFLAVSSYGSATQSSGRIRITKEPGGDIAGLDVLLVEDIVDTGLTVKKIGRMLRRQAPRSLRIVALLDKPGRRIEPVKLNYVGFEVPDEFLVGYGLDFDERYRNLPDVHVLESGSRETASPGQ